MSGMQTEPYQAFARDFLGFEFENIDLLITAFTHRSYVNEHRKSVSVHNERLEFLGDAVLELVVTDFLFNNYTEPEGILTSWRASLVRTESIGAAGIKLGYEPLIRMSRGEKQGGERARTQILANAFEALIGAIYLERGYADAEVFIKKHIASKLENILSEGSWRASLVRTESIGAAGIKLGYEPLIRMSRGEKQGGERARTQILANAFEALIGAIYLERGYGDAEVFIKKHIASKLENILTEGSWRDPKSHLQEVMQRKDGVTPRYVVIEEVGPDHDKVFTLGVYSGDRLISQGTGPSKQAAQQEAAKTALLQYEL